MNGVDLLSFKPKFENRPKPHSAWSKERAKFAIRMVIEKVTFLNINYKITIQKIQSDACTLIYGGSGLVCRVLASIFTWRNSSKIDLQDHAKISAYWPWSQEGWAKAYAGLDPDV